MAFVNRAVLALLLVAAACSPSPEPGDTDGPTSDDSATSQGTGTVGMTSTTGGTATQSTSVGTTGTSTLTGTTSSTATSDDSCGFIGCDPTSTCELEPDPYGDGLRCSIECSLFDQDCPDGEQCVPWDSDFDGAWDAKKCAPVSGDGVTGDPCTVEISIGSGTDDCALGYMCWNIDAETLTGTCVEMCSGSYEDPECPQEGDYCTIANGGALILCLPTCDPLMQNCDEGELCANYDDQFVCVPDYSEGEGVAGSTCVQSNTCNPGHACVGQDYYPAEGCEGPGCCAPFCNLEDPDPNAPCTLEGTECVAWIENGGEPPGPWDHVGACVVPL